MRACRLGCRPRPQGCLPFCREEGLTTVGVAVALLVVLALLFASLQAYWVGTRSGQVQYVADAGALAADAVVAEYVTAGQVVDAALLSLSLLGLTVYAVSVVCAFIPGAEGVAQRFADAGSKVLKTRDDFAATAQRGLNAAQAALPALCAVRAAECIEANARVSGIDYGGLAVALPLEGVRVELVDGSSVTEAAQEMEEQERQIQEDVQARERAQEALDAAWERAWRADCGNEGACMRERTSTLAGLAGADNPTCSSAQNWSFTLALNRAKAYYRARAQQEPGEAYDGTPEEIGESVARRQFYRYALTTVSQGTVKTGAGGAEVPHLKSLARNVSQVRQTSLYTEAVYPVSASKGAKTLHAYTGCPVYQAQSAAGTAAVSGIDAGTVQVCSECRFSATTLGRVPSASTSISNGFEYWYRMVVEAAEEYRAAQEELDRAGEGLGEALDTVRQALSSALASVAGARYDPQPPGRYGCVCIVYAPGVTSQGLSAFLAGEAQVGARVALSGATLMADGQANQAQVVEQAAAGLLPQEAVSSGLMKGICSVWGTLLEAYSGGVDGLVGAFDGVLGKVPVVGTSLSEQVASELRGLLKDAGLQPAEMKAYKPVLVNTSYLLERDDGALSQGLLQLKRAAEGAAELRVGALGTALASAEAALDGWEVNDGVLTLATLSLAAFGLGLGERSVTLEAPDDLGSQYAALLASLQGALAAAGG